MNAGIFKAGLAGAVLLAAGLTRGSAIDREAVSAFHASVREAAEEFPVDYDGWMGSEVDVPPSATKLLRPNVLVARRYETPARGGIDATVMVVQCGDIRDMQGHYPPNCYPAHGWQAEGEPDKVAFGDLQAVRYRFVQRVENSERRIVVFNVFILPSGESTTSMRRVRDASSDYRVRPYGAAQVQVVLDREFSEEDQEWVLSEMRRVAAPVIDVLRLGSSAASSKGVRP